MFNQAGGAVVLPDLNRIYTVRNLLPRLSRSLASFGKGEVINGAQTHVTGTAVKHVPEHPRLGCALDNLRDLEIETAAIRVPPNVIEPRYLARR
jgi:hypothetical protein